MKSVEIPFPQRNKVVIFFQISCEKSTISHIFNVNSRAGTFFEMQYAIVIHMVLKILKNAKNLIYIR